MKRFKHRECPKGHSKSKFNKTTAHSNAFHGWTYHPTKGFKKGGNPPSSPYSLSATLRDISKIKIHGRA